MKSVERLDGLATAVTFSWTVGFDPVMIHRLQQSLNVIL